KLNHSSKPGDSTSMAFGPGSIFQFDWSVVNTALTSVLFPQKVVNRPYIYLGVDVFSHAIVIAEVSFLRPSWERFKTAFLHSMLDPRPRLSKLRILVEDENDVCFGRPQAILADRGEAISKQAEQITLALGVRVSNTAAFRADMKGIVEALLGLIQRIVDDDIPASLPRKFRRGDKDYRLDAVLNIDEYREILQLAVLYYNHFQYLDNYPVDFPMIEDQVPRVPIRLWQWGIGDKGGILSNVDEEKARLALLPRARGSITGKGILFKRSYYMCEDPEIRKLIQVQAVKKKRVPVEVSYDAGGISDIIRLHFDHHSYLCFRAKDAKQDIFVGRDFEELQIYHQLEDEKRRLHEENDRQERAHENARRRVIVQTAEERTRKAIFESGASISARMGDVSAMQELERESDLGQIELQDKASLSKPQTTRIQSRKQVGEHVLPPDYLDILEELDEECNSDRVANK
ncbi:MAG: hypothetical protein ABI700_00480, partial [Chloroflexota bacterium]